MPTYFRDRIHSPLSRADAEALVGELEEVLEDALPADGEDEGEAYDDEAASIYEDLQMEVASEPPPANANQAYERAKATGYAESSFVFEPAAIALLPACRSTIAIRYPHHLRHMAAFVALMKRMFARTGPGTVVDGETTYETAETWGAGSEPWKETGAMQTRAEREVEERARREAERPKVKRREAKPGEAEALLLHEKLTKIIEGRDPLARSGLRKALERTTEDVRTYAAALLELGPKSDAAIATTIGRKAADVGAARETLNELLEELLED